MSFILSSVCDHHVLNQLLNCYFYKKHLAGVHHNQGLWNSSYFINSGIAPLQKRAKVCSEKCKLMTNTNHLRRANELKRLGMDGMKSSFMKENIWHSTLVYNQYHTVWYTNTLSLWYHSNTFHTNCSIISINYQWSSTLCLKIMREPTSKW